MAFPNRASTYKFIHLAASADQWFVRAGDELQYVSAPITVNNNTLAETVRVKRAAGSNQPQRLRESFFWEVREDRPGGAVWVDLGWATGPKELEQELLSLYRGIPGVVVAGEPRRQGAGSWGRFLFFGPRSGPGRNTADDVRSRFYQGHPNNPNRQQYP